MTSCPLPISHSSRNAPWKPLAIVSGSVAAVSAGVLYGLAQTSLGSVPYEGRIQLRLDPESAAAVAEAQRLAAQGAHADAQSMQMSANAEADDIQTTDIQTAASSALQSVALGGAAPESFTPEYATQNSRSLSPTLRVEEELNSKLNSSQVRFLSSPEVIQPVLEKLRSHHINLSYHEFSQRLTLRPLDHQTLEVIYHDEDSHTVAQVLDAIAQAYGQQGESCTVSVCRAFAYVQIQMGQTTQHLDQLQAQWEQLSQQQGGSLDSSRLQVLYARANRLNRQIRSVYERRSQAYEEFTALHHTLGLTRGNSVAMETLARSPQYRTLIEQWIRTNRQWVEAQFPTATLTTAATITSTSATVDGIEADQHALVDQLDALVSEMVAQTALFDWPDDVREAIVQNPSRLGMLEPWLLQAHQLYMLQTRQQHLKASAERLMPQVEQQQAMQQERHKLLKQIERATETLDGYRQRYRTLYPQVLPRQSVWQLVSPPEVQRTELASVASHAGQALSLFGLAR